MGNSVVCTADVKTFGCAHNAQVPQHNDQPDSVEPATLLEVLEARFAETLDDAATIAAGDLLEVWLTSARYRIPQLLPADEKFLESVVRSYLSDRGLDDSHRVAFPDVVAFVREHAACLLPSQQQSTRTKLIVFFTRHPAALCRAVGNRCEVNRVTLSVRLQCLADAAGAVFPPSDFPDSAFCEATRLFEEMQADLDGTVDILAAIALYLRRKLRPVELLLYDVSKGISSRFSSLLLGHHLEAVYHSSVVVYGLEYWYGGEVFENSPPLHESLFGPPLKESVVPLVQSEYSEDLKVVNLGDTLLTHEEFLRFLNESLKLKYRRDNYDVLNHNCNCFSDALVRHLTGSGIPGQILHLPETLLNTPAGQVLNPVINKWLGGIQSPTGAESDAPDENTHTLSTPRRTLNPAPHCPVVKILQPKKNLTDSQAAGLFVGCGGAVERQLSDDEFFQGKSETPPRVLDGTFSDPVWGANMEREGTMSMRSLPGDIIDCIVDDETDEEGSNVRWDSRLRRRAPKRESIRRNTGGTLVAAKTGDEVFLDRDVIRQDVKFKAVRRLPGGEFIPAKLSVA
eukprot:TRINITY_DN30091_c0_g1_i1.p1 TRINITY_DN30091_c0_g1~~TRINITY_DN30091_c0_g1_i1.p1  ORF type:complete len:569 (+),score=83.73 TRINITY_DN30091_c0_g1_i1:132-1838(+)